MTVTTLPTPEMKVRSQGMRAFFVPTESWGVSGTHVLGQSSSSAFSESDTYNRPAIEAHKSVSSDRIKLTRRGRIVFGTLGSLCVLLVFSALATVLSPQASAASDGASAEFGYVIVQPGASLWQVAGQLDPTIDPRDLVSEIVRLNQLSDSGVQAGQPIAVPLRYSGHDGVIAASELGF